MIVARASLGVAASPRMRRLLSLAGLKADFGSPTKESFVVRTEVACAALAAWNARSEAACAA